MAEINKLSVGKVLDKLRSNDASVSKIARDQKIDELDKEIQRLRSANRRLERDQRAGLTLRDAPETNPRRVAKTKLLAWLLGLIVLCLLVFALVSANH
jgi:hypothetical protein